MDPNLSIALLIEVLNHVSYSGIIQHDAHPFELVCDIFYLNLNIGWVFSQQIENVVNVLDLHLHVLQELLKTLQEFGLESYDFLVVAFSKEHVQSLIERVYSGSGIRQQGTARQISLKSSGTRRFIWLHVINSDRNLSEQNRFSPLDLLELEIDGGELALKQLAPLSFISELSRHGLISLLERLVDVFLLFKKLEQLLDLILPRYLAKLEPQLVHLLGDIFRLLVQGQRVSGAPFTLSGHTGVQGIREINRLVLRSPLREVQDSIKGLPSAVPIYVKAWLDILIIDARLRHVENSSLLRPGAGSLRNGASFDNSLGPNPLNLLRRDRLVGFPASAISGLQIHEFERSLNQIWKLLFVGVSIHDSGSIRCSLS